MVGFIQLYNLMYLADPSSNNLCYITQLFYRVSIALSIDFAFSSFSFRLQMSYLNIAAVRVWKKKLRKHIVVAFILTALTLCYFSENFFSIVADKNPPRTMHNISDCTGPFVSLRFRVSQVEQLKSRMV